MGLLNMLPLLASMLQPVAAGKTTSVQLCQKEPDAQVRLACYDALARSQSAPGVQNSVNDGFWLEKDAINDNLTLQRQAGAGAMFSVACLNQITHVQVRLTLPWEGEAVTSTVDGAPASGNWFVRDRGRLLEFGRGLVAIDELKRWSGLRELTLRSHGGREIHIPLNGLGEAIKPLRQQCRW